MPFWDILVPDGTEAHTSRDGIEAGAAGAGGLFCVGVWAFAAGGDGYGVPL